LDEDVPEELGKMADTQDIRPVPDPTALTMEASARLEAMLRILIATEIQHEQKLVDQKLAEIRTILAMLDSRTAEQKKDTKDALDAALAAAKEAVANQSTSSEKSITKSETATIERIKAVETLLTQSTIASNDKVDDLKSRIVAIEAVKLGNVEQDTTIRSRGVDMRGNMAIIISIITSVISVVGVVVAIIIATKP
jgi:hypothetical protein